ncbi:EAL domain-containing protein [Nitratiruptor sp. SB155-2]|uniref:EAL domain-containing protein n=1 Tax=Nitratiruptor sp. (strain SB155-2) TaxID=387092 RepID=UPI00015873E3|nr:EAL domain-containing protein [Nitratiruptor sp. SB155-2]BAF70184.1 two-component response regulator [Nitratiruptor sp. SB155-2]
MKFDQKEIAKLKELSVLYVEDEKEITKFMTSIFSNYFKKVWIAQNGEEGYKKYKRFKPDIIISDIIMPKMDGLQMSAKIREKDLEQIIVFFTAYSDTAYLLESIKLGINGYILKPFSLEQFLTTILNVTRVLFYKREKEYYQKRLEFMTKYDPLTNLYQRNLFIEFLEKLLKRSDRTKELMAILFLDVDNFKDINDTFGHDMGDCVLKTIANRLTSISRQEDIVSRISGDEFAMILWGLKSKEAIYSLLDRLQKEMRKPIDCNGKMINISMSIGATFYPQDRAIGANELLKQADLAMYYIKKKKKGEFFIFDPYDSNFAGSMRECDQRVVEIERAFINHEFVLYYQPKICLKNRQLKGYEVLIRWNHPKKGILIPSHFLPYIENNESLMKQLSHYVLEQVAKDITDFMLHDTSSDFSVNITVYDIESEIFLDFFQDILKRYNISASRFVFEIVETSALKDLLRAKKMFEELKDLGSKIAIDDFGTGYASLTYMQNFDVDFVKIDTSFVVNMLEDKKSYEIIKASIALAKIFGYKIIAEGVENEAIMQELEKLGCDYVQGFYIAPPMPKEEILEKLKNNQLLFNGKRE